QRVGNWPGLTIELSSARLLLGGHMVELVDLPGVNDLTGYSDDEAVVRDVLQASAFDGAILVLNASQLDRQLPLALQVLASGLNCHVVLNMADEAKALGVSLDVERLSERLGAPVSLVSAKRMQGWPPLMTGLNRLANTDAPAARARLDAVPETRAAMEQARLKLEGCWALPPIKRGQVTHAWRAAPRTVAGL
ncbi:ferrous iron transporter B, partial [Pseudomonas sp. MWU13-2860]